MDLDFDVHAVGGEGQLGVLRKDRAGGFGVALEIVAALGSAEELLLEGALQGVSAHFKIDGVRGRGLAQEGEG